MKRILLVLAFIFLAASVGAADVKLKDYPYFFVKDGLFNARYVVGAESPALDTVTATILSTNLARFEDFKTAVGTSALDSDISDIRNVNAIVIGNPCVNKAAWQLEGYPGDCEEGLDNSTGYIKIFSNGNKVQVLITGLSEDDRQVMGEKLAEGDFDNVNHDFVAYPTRTGSTSSPGMSPPSSPTMNSSVTHTPTTAAVVETAEPEQVKKLEPKTSVVEEKPEPYERIDIWNHRKKPGFFGRLWNSIIRVFRAVF